MACRNSTWWPGFNPFCKAPDCDGCLWYRDDDGDEEDEDGEDDEDDPDGDPS